MLDKSKVHDQERSCTFVLPRQANKEWREYNEHPKEY